MLTKRKKFCATSVGLEHHDAPLGGRAPEASPARCPVGCAVRAVPVPAWARGKQEPNCSWTLPEQTSKTHLPLFCVLCHWATWLKQISGTKNGVAFLWGDKTNEKNQGWLNVLWILRGESTVSRTSRGFFRTPCFLTHVTFFQHFRWGRGVGCT